MSTELDREAYGLIWRLGRHSLAQTLKVFGQLVQKQTFSKPISHRFETEGVARSKIADLDQHPAVREYRRMIWRGWHIDYDQTPEAYSPGGCIVMKRGARRRVITVAGAD